MNLSFTVLIFVINTIFILWRRRYIIGESRHEIAMGFVSIVALITLGLMFRSLPPGFNFNTAALEIFGLYWIISLLLNLVGMSLLLRRSQGQE